MDIIGTMIIIAGGFFLIVFSFWLIFSIIIEHQMRRRERIKRKKGQSFKEHLLYTRFKMQIPKVLLYFYYSLIFLHLMLGLFAVLIYILGINGSIIHKIDVITIFFGIADMVIIAAFAFIFSSPKRSQFIIGRWVKKNKI